MSDRRTYFEERREAAPTRKRGHTGHEGRPAKRFQGGLKPHQARNPYLNAQVRIRCIESCLVQAIQDRHPEADVLDLTIAHVTMHRTSMCPLYKFHRQIKRVTYFVPPKSTFRPKNNHYAIRVLEGSLEDVDFDEKFDVIYCKSLHVTTVENLFYIARCLKRGGHLVVLCDDETEIGHFPQIDDQTYRARGENKTMINDDHIRSTAKAEGFKVDEELTGNFTDLFPKLMKYQKLAEIATRMKTDREIDHKQMQVVRINQSYVFCRQ